jgi:hypothetical protein
MPLIQRVVRLEMFIVKVQMELGGHALQIENLENARSVVTDMNRKTVKSKHAEGVTFDTHVIANPTNPKEWIVFFKKDAGRSYFLVDDNEEVESFGHLDDLIAELRELGLKTAEIHF